MSRLKTMPELINDVANNRIADMHIAMPADIQSYNAAQRKANVKPLLARRLKDGRILDIPVVNNVPVVWPGTGKGGFFMPLEVGDTVLLVFSERSLDEWLTAGGQVTPEDRRRNDLSDAIAIPGLFSFNNDIGANAADLKIKFNDSTIVLAANGDIKINAGPNAKVAMGNASQELLDLFDQLLQLLITSTTATSIGPQPLSVVGDITNLKTDLAEIKGTL